ncbi:MAG: spermine synthase [Planctomycetes bacterium]|nr:spermine synthase [Planctomycetota bacterium]
MVRLLFVAYGLSGAAALIYQVVWQRWLVFTVGLSTVGIGIIVAGFLAGLGLGYLAGGRLADRLTPRAALGSFALLEVGIALCALASGPLLHGWLPTVEGLGPRSPWLTFAVVFGLLLPPTFLMGASLPILSRSIALETVLHQAGFIARLYFVNTLGGAVAAAATALVLASTVGFDGAVRVGAALNLLCAATGWMLRRRTRTDAVEPLERATALAVAPPPSTWWWTGWLAHAFAAGLTGIAWEVLAFRVVENVVKSRAQTLAVILAVLLTGLAVGSLVGDRLRERLGARRRAVFLASQVALYAWLAGSVALLVHALERWGVARPWLDSIGAYEPSMSTRMLALNYAFLPLALLFCPALLMGLGFSLSQQLLQTSFASVGRRLGRVQFVNILGCVAGAILTTHVAIPRIGTSGALRLVALVGVFYAVVWLLESRGRRMAPLSMGLVLGLAVANVPGQDRLWRVLSGQADEGRLIYREDASGVSSLRLTAPDSRSAEVFANGLGQSSLPRPLDGHHVLLGAIPTLIHPRPRRVAIIGLGSGGTLWGASARPEMERGVAWEIMASQPSLLAEYAQRTGDRSVDWFLRDPRLEIVHADGRHALRASVERFDVIEADALRAISSYAGNLYSLEFFLLVRSRLAPGGLAATWVPTPRVLETMRRAFPHVVYLGNLVALGSESPLEVDWREVAERASHPDVRAHFAQGGVDLLSLLEPVFSRGPAALALLGPLDPERLNTDMHPRDELPSPWSVLEKLRAR